MSKVRIVFLGTPDIAVACLERLLTDDHYEVVAVITQPDRPAGRQMKLTPTPVKQLALEKGLQVFTPESVNTPEFCESIQAMGAESAVVVAFGQILSDKFLGLFPKGCVNVHASLLPRWRGAAPIQRAIMAGDDESGVCLQKVVRKLDAGPLLGSRHIKLTDDIDAATLYEKLKVLGADLLHVEYMDYLRGNLVPSVQDESLVTYAKKIEKTEAKIDWQRGAREILNQIRGLTMGPIACTERDGKLLKIHRVKVAERAADAAPGTILAVTGESFVVACGQGALEVVQVQPESRAKQSVADYLRGYPLKPGDRLG